MQLCLLAPEHLEAQLVGALVRADTTAGAATPVHDAGLRHLDEIIRNHVYQVARLLHHATTT
jgi:hypothetical protein